MAEDRDKPADRRIGSLVGERWRLETRLGEGGMATVYSARDPSGARAAVKVLHDEMARKADVRARFLREAYVANRIGHPGAVRILEHGEGTDTYLVMELLEGVPLSVRLRHADQITLRELLSHADQILDVLARAHDQGIVHRDIKPDNIFLTNAGQVKILDFGIARVLDDVGSELKTRTGLALGTIPYMAPEQALGKRTELDGRADVFALGAMLFRVLAGRRIHEAPSDAELLVAMATQPAPKLGSVAPGVPDVVCAIVDNALAFSRDARYPNARTMQTDVRAVLAGALPPYVGVGAPAHLDAPTRIEAVGPASLDSPVTRISAGATTPRSAHEAPTRIEAPAALGARSAVAAPPVSRPPHSFGPSPSAVPVSQPPMSLGVPMSQPPMSLGVPMSLPSPSPAAPVVAPAAPSTSRSKTGVVLALLGAGAVLLAGGLAAAAFAFGFFRADETSARSSAGAAAPEATGASADGVVVPTPPPGGATPSTSQARSGAAGTPPPVETTAPQAEAPGSEPAAALAPAEPTGAAAPHPDSPSPSAPGASPAGAGGSSAAPKTAAATAAPAPAAPAAAPTATATRSAATPTSPASTPPPATTSTGAGRATSPGSQGQGKAKGKSKAK